MADITKSANLVIPAGRVPVAAYQAIYHKLTDTTDSFSRYYKGAYSVTKEDFIALHQRLEQAIQQYRVEGKKSNFVMLFEEWQMQDVNSIEKLEFYNFKAIPAHTRIIVFSFDFLAVLPVEIKEAENIAQRYKVEVTVKQRDDDLVYAFAHLDEESDKNRIQEDIQISVEYADFSVGRGLITVLEDWVRSLPNRDPEKKAVNGLKKMRRILEISPLVFSITSLVAAAAYDIPSRMGISPIRYLLICIAITILFIAISIWLSDRILRLLAGLAPRTHILFTRGDDLLCEKESKLALRRKGLISFFGVAVFVAFAVNIMATYLASMLF